MEATLDKELNAQIKKFEERLDSELSKSFKELDKQMEQQMGANLNTQQLFKEAFKNPSPTWTVFVSKEKTPAILLLLIQVKIHTISQLIFLKKIIVTR